MLFCSFIQIGFFWPRCDHLKVTDQFIHLLVVLQNFFIVLLISICFCSNRKNVFYDSTWCSIKSEKFSILDYSLNTRCRSWKNNFGMWYKKTEMKNTQQKIWEAIRKEKQIRINGHLFCATVDKITKIFDTKVSKFPVLICISKIKQKITSESVSKSQVVITKLFIAR